MRSNLKWSLLGCPVWSSIFALPSGTLPSRLWVGAFFLNQTTRPQPLLGMHHNNHQNLLVLAQSPDIRLVLLLPLVVESPSPWLLAMWWPIVWWCDPCSPWFLISLPFVQSSETGDLFHLALLSSHASTFHWSFQYCQNKPSSCRAYLLTSGWFSLLYLLVAGYIYQCHQWAIPEFLSWCSTCHPLVWAFLWRLVCHLCLLLDPVVEKLYECHARLILWTGSIGSLTMLVPNWWNHPCILPSGTELLNAALHPLISYHIRMGHRVFPVGVAVALY